MATKKKKAKILAENEQGVAKFIQQNGLLFEINRLIFHPLGFALVMSIDEHGKYKFHHIKKAESPEGYTFSTRDFQDAKKKLKKLYKKFPVNTAARAAALSTVAHSIYPLVQFLPLDE